MKATITSAIVLSFLFFNTGTQPRMTAAAVPGELPQEAAKPSPRAGHCLVYDEQLRKVILLDGYQPPYQPELGEAWAWDGRKWQLLPGSGPIGRFYGAAVYDLHRKKIISYGGVSYGTRKGFTDDTWQWDGKSWQQLADTSVGTRFLHAMAYDAAHGKTVLYGGIRPDNSYITDTSEWDGVKWTQMTVPGPGARSHFAMAYNSRHKQVVLFGGVGTKSHNDTWTWDGKTWQQVSQEGPPGRVRHAMAFDSRAGVVLLYGGSVSRTEHAGDLWKWDGQRWTEIKMTGPTPGKRGLHAMAYDAARGKTVLYGGKDFTTGKILDDTWEWDGQQWAQVK